MHNGTPRGPVHFLHSIASVRYDVHLDGDHFKRCAAAFESSRQDQKVHRSQIRPDGRGLWRVCRDLATHHRRLKDYELGAVYWYQGRIPERLPRSLLTHLSGEDRGKAIGSHRATLRRQKRFFEALELRSVKQGRLKVRTANVRIKETRDLLVDHLQAALQRLGREFGQQNLLDRVETEVRLRLALDPRYEEKEIDGKVAVDLIDLASKHKSHVSMLLSNDRDFVPVIEHVKECGGHVMLLQVPNSGVNPQRDLRGACASRLSFPADSFSKAYAVLRRR